MSNMSDLNYTEKRNSNNEISSFKLMVITGFLSFILFITLTGQSIVIPIYPLYAKLYGGGAFQLGLLIGFYSLPSIILAPILGSLADKYGRKLFILVSLIGFTFANLLYITVYSFNILLFYRIIEGSTAAGIGAIVNAFLIDIIPINKRAKYLGIVNGSGFLGIVVGPFIGSIFLINNDITMPFVLTSLIAIIGIVLAYFILPNDYDNFKNKTKTIIVNQTPFFEKINFTTWLVSGGSLVFVILIIIRLFGLLSWNITQPAVPVYLYGLNYSKYEVGVFFSVFGITTFLGQLLLGGLSDKYGRKIILQIGVFMYLVGFLTLFNATSIIMFFVFGIISGVGLSLLIPALVSLLADLTKDPSHRGKVMGIYYGVFYLAGAFGPLIGGYLSSILHFEFVLSFVILIAFVQFLLSLFVKSVKKDNLYVISDQTTANYDLAD